MYLKDYLKQFGDKKIKLYVDMDGVIADFHVEYKGDFHKTRPLKSNISKIEEISKMNNVEVYILSVSRMDEGLNQKQEWLDINAPFFKKENRIIISRESNNFETSINLKMNFLKNIKRDDSAIVFIDDDPAIVIKAHENIKDIFLLKDSALVD